MDEMNAAPSPSFRVCVKQGGFSLIELLVVMAIMLVLLSLAGAAFSSLAVGSTLTRAGLMVSDQFAVARQEAVTRNREMEVRVFYLPKEPSPGWKGIQIFRIEENGDQVPSTRMESVPDGICITDDGTLSPLLMSGNAIQGTAPAGSHGNLNYRAFRFRPNGSVAGSPGSNNFITLRHVTAQGSPPANFYTVQVHPVTGKVTSYRP